MTWTLIGPGGAPTMAVPVDNAPRQAPYMVANAREAHSLYIIVLVDVFPLKISPADNLGKIGARNQ